MKRTGYSSFVFIAFIISTCLTYSHLTYSQPRSIEINTANNDRDFFRSLGDYYQAPQKEIKSLAQSLLLKEELPVIYFIARTANVSPSEVLTLRTKGMTYTQITKAYNLKAGIFMSCMDPSKCILHPEQKGKFILAKKAKRNLNDKKIIESVNIKFISEGHLCSPFYVSRLRKEGNDFLSINEKIIEEQKVLTKELKARYRNEESRQITQSID